MRGHLVAWLLGYSVTDRGGIAEKKKNREKKTAQGVFARDARIFRHKIERLKIVGGKRKRN